MCGSAEERVGEAMFIMLTALWIGLFTEAHAQGEPELAIPARNPQAMHVYRADHLRVVPVTSWTYHNQTVGFSTYSGYGWSSFFALGPSFATPHHEWRVAKGPTVISVPRFLELSGQTELREDLLQKVKRNKTAATVFGGVAAVSAATLIAGLFTEANATDVEGQILGMQMYNYGGLGVAVGLVAASIPGGRAKRWVAQPSAVMTPEEAEGFVRQHNDALRASLGLTPTEAFEIEQAEPHHRR